MIPELQNVQKLDHMQNPLFIQRKQRQDHDAGHGGHVKQADLMNPKEKEFHQHQSGAQIFIERVRTELRDVQKPHAEAARRNQRNRPQLPRHDGCDQAQRPAEHRYDDSQQQVPACLLLRPHDLSSSWATRFKSSFGWKGFFR